MIHRICGLKGPELIVSILILKASSNCGPTTAAPDFNEPIVTLELCGSMVVFATRFC